MKNNLGYTLIEVMVALLIFVIIAGTTSGILYHVFNTRDRINAQAKELGDLQLAITLIQRDTQQMVDRAILGNDMHNFPPFIGLSNYVEFTHGGVVNPNGEEERSTLSRVAFLCEKNQLIRRSWAHLDLPSRNTYVDSLLLSNLEGCSFAYLGKNLQRLSEWKAYALQQNQQNETLPLALQLQLKVHGWGESVMLFIIPQSLYDEKGDS